MFNPNNWFQALFVIPILNILMGFYALLTFLHVPYPLGFSLILLTAVIRLILNPLTASQLRSSQKLAKLKPELDHLSKIYKDDKQRLHQEQLRLYQQAGINPAAGCLPLLLQMPILIALYNLFFQLLSAGDMAKVAEGVNKVVYFPFLRISGFDLNFFGMNLSSKPSDWQRDGWWLLLVPIITALLQYWQTKTMTPAASSAKIVKKDEKDKDKKPEEDMAASMQKQMAIMMPIMIGFFAYSFQLGLSLYWNTFTLFGIIQQYQIAKSGEKHEEKHKK